MKTQVTKAKTGSINASPPPFVAGAQRHAIELLHKLCLPLFAAGLLALPRTARAGDVVLYWLQEGSGTIAIDSSGNGNHGILVNGTAYTTGDRDGTFCLFFNGVSNRIDMPVVLYGRTNRTVSAWIQTTATNCTIVDDNQWGGCCPGTYMGITADGRLAGHHFNFTVYQDILLVSMTRVNDGQWHHIALALSGISGARLFVDDVLEATNPIPAQAYYANHMTLGCHSSGNAPYFTEFFTGKLDDFRVEDVARTNFALQQWVATPIDSDGRPFQIALDRLGKPRLLYGGPNNALPSPQLIYKAWSESGWQSSLVPVSGGITGAGLAIASDNTPRMVLYDIGNNSIRYGAGSTNGSAWNLENVETWSYIGKGGLKPAIALGSGDVAHVGYFFEPSEALHYGLRSSGNWGLTSVDSTYRVGKDSHIVIDSTGQPHLSYGNQDLITVRYARKVGANWLIEDAVSGFDSKLAVDSVGVPHLVAFNEAQSTWRYANRRLGTWTSLVFSTNGIGVPNIAIDSAGRMQTMLSRSIDQSLLHFVCDGTNWTTEVLPPAFSGMVVWDMTIDSRNNLYAFARATNGSLVMIYQAPNSPLILKQPQTMVGYWGKCAAFSVAATNGPLNYQWFKDGSPISGATNATLALCDLQLGAAGNYSVVVCNGFECISSQAASLFVNPAGVSLGMYAGLTIDGVVGRQYRIEYATDLNLPNWKTLATLTLSISPQVWIDMDSLGQPKRFYRVTIP